MTTISVTTATVSEMPSTVRQWARMVETAPSRISPTPSGRSGITPGLAAGGGRPSRLPSRGAAGRAVAAVSAGAAGGRVPPQPGPGGGGGAWPGPGAGRRGPLAGRRLLLGPLRAGAASVGVGWSAGSRGPGGRLGGRAGLLPVGGGRSGRGPARSVVHRRSFTVPVRGRGGRLAAIVPRGARGVTGRLYGLHTFNCPADHGADWADG